MATSFPQSKITHKRERKRGGRGHGREEEKEGEGGKQMIQNEKPKSLQNVIQK